MKCQTSKLLNYAAISLMARYLVEVFETKSFEFYPKPAPTIFVIQPKHPLESIKNAILSSFTFSKSIIYKNNKRTIKRFNYELKVKFEIKKTATTSTDSTAPTASTSEMPEFGDVDAAVDYLTA